VVSALGGTETTTFIVLVSLELESRGRWFSVRSRESPSDKARKLVAVAEDADELPDFGDWDVEGLGREFDDERARAILDELVSIFNEEIKNRAVWDYVVDETRPRSGDADDATLRAFHAASASARFDALMVLRSVARYMADHEPRG
jgi:hypothetical protein